MKVWNVKVKCSGKFGQVMAGENTQVFLTWNLKNKLLKKCVLWMIVSRIHKNMKISRGGSVPKTRLLWRSTQYIITVMTEIAVMSYDRSFSYTVICINSWQLCQFGLFFFHHSCLALFSFSDTKLHISYECSLCTSFITTFTEMTV